MKIKTKLFVKLMAVIAVVTAITVIISCKKKSDSTPMPSTPSTPMSSFTQTNLVADTLGFNAARVDANLVNPWGMSVNTSAGIIWISSNHGGSSVVYDSLGNQKLAPVIIPTAAAGVPPGAPSGQVFNTTTGFMTGGSPAKFIFVTEDGTISAWNSGTSATVMVDSSAHGAVYKGVELAANGTSSYLYVANFEQKRVDVYDETFTYKTGFAFNDPGIPSNYGPFNIKLIGTQLYVVYAQLQPPPSMDDQKGPGFGYISIFNTDGTFVKRFASNGTLNSPWGIVQAPSTFGTFANDIIVGNFGDGNINVFDSNGNYKGQLEDSNGKIISIDGLWGLMFPVNGQPAVNANRLYFTAGPDDENQGLFGYLTIH